MPDAKKDESRKPSDELLALSYAAHLLFADMLLRECEQHGYDHPDALTRFSPFHAARLLDLVRNANYAIEKREHDRAPHFKRLYEDPEVFSLAQIFYVLHKEKHLELTPLSLPEAMEDIKYKLSWLPWYLPFSKTDMITMLESLRDSVVDTIKNVRGATYKPRTLNVEKYADRINKKEEPPDFLKRAYEDYLDDFLSPIEVKHNDKKFYDYFQVWCHRNKREVDEFFPQLPYYVKYKRERRMDVDAKRFIEEYFRLTSDVAETS